MKPTLLITISLLLITSLTANIKADAIAQTKGQFEDKFRQLDESLPTPNVYRNAAGEPGHQYWQQRVDYQIKASLDEKKRRLSGHVEITYKNNSPDTLKYLWLQLDQNRFKSSSMGNLSQTFSGLSVTKGKDSWDNSWGHPAKKPAKISLNELRKQQFEDDNKPGYDIQSVQSGSGDDLHYVINGTQMRLDLPKSLKPGKSVTFAIKYAYNITEQGAVGGRAGYEHFPDDAREGGNDIFQIAQWYPRLAAYTDYEAWTNKEFLGSGEFTLEFGDYYLQLTVPADHIVSATGELDNPSEVLTKAQRKRLSKASTAKRPVYIVTPYEALQNEKAGTSKTKTWEFRAENVRDVAWASSRKFMWDAKGFNQGGKVQPHVMAMSFFPKEGNPLWEKYSTESVIHTLEVYSRFSFDYPYPIAQSVNGPVGGMEYPMITFNGPRTDLQDDGTRTYSLAEKRFLIGVVIHEVGHIYFPMTVNSDERQWTWMDEGLNSFLDGIAGREWDPSIPWGVEPKDIVDYMKSEYQVPVMTQSDSILQFGPNAYTKPAVALNILRETILGRELFDFAFKEYSRRWMFKRPTPADFFRTMEEASGVDLDWFWRGWFYSTDHVDISLDRVYRLRLDTRNPDIDFSRRRQEELDKPSSVFVDRNKQEGKKLWVDRNKDVTDFHDENDRFTATNKDRNDYKDFIDGLEDWEKKVLERAVKEDKNYYVLEFSNKGGLVMPIILGLTFADGTTEEVRLPAEIWRKSPARIKKLFVFDKELQQIEVDPKWETADVDVENNHYPRKIIQSRLEMFKARQGSKPEDRDLMQDAKASLDKDEEVEQEDDDNMQEEDYD
ncbi:MAG: aminopeptidase [Gammaproteobacteria bacterium]|nr:MAG: aminopeptidase [Gammaproteobacteria bacterium]